MEKRRFERLGIQLGGGLEITHRKGPSSHRIELAGQIQSVSPQGMAFQVAAPGETDVALALKQDNRVRVRFALDSARLELPARVVYTRGPSDAPYVGLRLELEIATAVHRQTYVAWVVGLLRSRAA